jgi:hypothetical protein
MTSSLPDSAAQNMQPIHYSIQLPTMTAPESLATVRSILQEQNLIVDQLVPGEVRVASATSSNPDWETIKSVLRAAGFPVEHTSTVTD